MIIRSKVKVNLFVLYYSICVILFFLKVNKAMESLMGSRVLVTLTSRVVYEELLQCNAKSLVCNVLQELEHDEKLRRAVQVLQLLCQEITFLLKFSCFCCTCI